jgi:hypothetical protein
MSSDEDDKAFQRNQRTLRRKQRTPAKYEDPFAQLFDDVPTFGPTSLRIVSEGIMRIEPFAVTLTNLIRKCCDTTGKTIKLQLDNVEYIARSCNRPYVKPLLKYFDPETFYKFPKHKYDSDSEDEDEDIKRKRRKNSYVCTIYMGISPKNSGKTTVIGELLGIYAQRELEKLRTVCITPRRAFAVFFVDEANKAFNKASVANVYQNYREFSQLSKSEEEGKTPQEIEEANKNFRPYLGDIPNLAIQLDSISRLFSKQDTPNWDIVFFDEWRATLRHLSTKFVKNKRDICGYLSNIFMKARNIIITDAYMRLDSTLK